MPPIGDTLREARMRQRLDIVDVEERTKIRAKYLRALENEEWALLPGPTFVRTFLRTYAEAVGLDPHVLVEAYRSQQDDGDEPEAQAQQPIAAAPRRRPSRSPRQAERRRPPVPGPPGPAALVGGAVVIVLVGLLLLGLLGNDSSSNDDQQRAQKTQTSKQTATPRAKRPAAPKKPAAPAGVTLKIEPSVPTYVCLDSGDGSQTVFEGILEQARTFKNPRQLRINLGKRAVKVTANGKPVKVAPSAEPLGLDVTKAGASEITAGPRPCA